MPSLPPFGQPGNWYKGNLHTHTNESDGRVSPSENLQWHADYGYDFVAITDHDRVTDPRAFVPQPPLLAIPAAEISARRGPVAYHILAYGIDQLPITPNREAQEVLDAVNGASGLCVVAHPYWHDHSLEDLLPLNGHIGIEIFNAVCWLWIRKGYALAHWDLLLGRGRRLWGFAADDSHFTAGDHGQAWVMVRSERLGTPAVLDALRAGHFYATMGPEIHDIQLEERQVTVRCSPAAAIYVTGDAWHSPRGAHAGKGPALIEAAFQLHPRQRYLRVEVVDAQGRSAWSNPVFLDQLA